MKGLCEDKGMVDLLFWVLGTNGLNAPGAFLPLMVGDTSTDFKVVLPC